jgi:hypothetical protein
MSTLSDKDTTTEGESAVTPRSFSLSGDRWYHEVDVRVASGTSGYNSMCQKQKTLTDKNISGQNLEEKCRFFTINRGRESCEILFKYFTYDTHIF